MLHCVSISLLFALILTISTQISGWPVKLDALHSTYMASVSLQWRHNECDGISNHRCLDCLLNCLFRPRLKKTLKLHVTGLCEGNSPATGGFPLQRASNVENVSIWWCHHGTVLSGWMASFCWLWLISVYMMMPWHGHIFSISGLLVTLGFPTQRASNGELWWLLSC